MWRARQPPAGGTAGRSSGLVHVASYREAALAEIDRSLRPVVDSESEARTARDIVRDSSAGVAPGADRGQQPPGHADRQRPARRGRASWRRSGNLSAPFSVVPMSPPRLQIRGTLRLARGELDERRRGPGRDRRGPRADADRSTPPRSPGARRSSPRSARSTAPPRRAGSSPSAENRRTRVRRRPRDRHDAARAGPRLSRSAPRSRPCASRSPRSSRRPAARARSFVPGAGGGATSRWPAHRVTRAASQAARARPLLRRRRARLRARDELAAAGSTPSQRLSHRRRLAHR